MKRKLIVIMLGPPGSGKGTQSVRLSEELGVPHISTGDLFRDNIAKGTELGKQAKEYLDAGKLSPDPLVFDMLFDRLDSPDSAGGCLLDGFPRNLVQAEVLKTRLGEHTKLIALNLNVSDETVIKRLSARLTCKNCGHIHNRQFSPPQSNGKCENCGGELYQRSDDTQKVIAKRLGVYHEQTAPLVEYYRKQGLLVDIKGENPTKQVHNDLRMAIQAGLSNQ